MSYGLHFYGPHSSPPHNPEAGSSLEHIDFGVDPPLTENHPCAGEVCAPLTGWSRTCPGRLRSRPPGQWFGHCWASWDWGRFSPKANMQNRNVTSCFKTLPGSKSS